MKERVRWDTLSVESTLTVGWVDSFDPCAEYFSSITQIIARQRFHGVPLVSPGRQRADRSIFDLAARGPKRGRLEPL